MSFLNDVVKEIGNEYAGFVSEGVAAGDVTSFIDTGSYLFNALVSGSIYGGLPSNKITALAGESSTGKTFFALSVVRNFLTTDPEAGCIYFESESAISRDMIESRGIPSDRMVIVPVTTVQEFRDSGIEDPGKLYEPEGTQTYDVCAGLSGYAVHHQGSSGLC